MNSRPRWKDDTAALNVCDKRDVCSHFKNYPIQNNVSGHLLPFPLKLLGPNDDLLWCEFDLPLCFLSAHVIISISLMDYHVLTWCLSLGYNVTILL